MARLEYFFRETDPGLRRNGLVAFAAISTTFIALLLFGLALLIGRQVDLMIAATTGNVEVVVYLDRRHGPRSARIAHARCSPSSRSSTTVTTSRKEEAYERFKELFARPAGAREHGRPRRAPGVAPGQARRPRAVPAGEARCCEDQPGDRRGRRPAATFLDRLFAVTGLFRRRRADRVGRDARLGGDPDREHGADGVVRAPQGDRHHEARRRDELADPNARSSIEGIFESLIGAGAAILFLFGAEGRVHRPALRRRSRFMPWVHERRRGRRSSRGYRRRGRGRGRRRARSAMRRFLDV